MRAYFKLLQKCRSTRPCRRTTAPITSTGAGTFGCKINGKVWVAKSNKTGWPPTYASINKQIQNETNISGSIINGNTDFVVINLVFQKKHIDNYSIGYTNSYIPSGEITDAVKNIFWGTDSIRGGSIKLSNFDSLNQILSGIFYFDCINKKTGEILHVTDGRFDMHYTY